jgi:hypothetical protein
MDIPSFQKRKPPGLKIIMSGKAPTSFVFLLFPNGDRGIVFVFAAASVASTEIKKYGENDY